MLKQCILFLSLLLSIMCNATFGDQTKEVVIYSSVDQEFSEPILKQFEKESGIKVKAIYDAEASKTVGLERRLISEKSRPKADVFWNSEYLRTFKLASEGVLAPYIPATVSEIPSTYLAEDHLWTGFGIRSRAFIVNNKLVPPDEAPKKLTDLIDPKWKGKAAIAQPYFGTTSTHFAALYARMGEKNFIDFLTALKNNQIALLPGNSDVKDAVVAGRYVFGLTDTDDINVALEKGAPVSMIYLDQDTDGSFDVFHTVALINGGPNPENAKQLIDYLTSSRVEQGLINSGAVQLSVRKEKNPGEQLPKLWHIAGEQLLKTLGPSAKVIRAYLE